VPIRLIIKNDHSFTPEEAAILIGVFEQVLTALQLVNREDPATLHVARIIIDLAKAGERDPVKLRDGTLEAVSSDVPR
jgi:hypothetical protein